jgi:hypothetical protein
MRLPPVDSQTNTFLLDMLIVLLISQKDYELCGNRKDWEGEFGSVGIYWFSVKRTLSTYG